MFLMLPTADVLSRGHLAKIDALLTPEICKFGEMHFSMNANLVTKPQE